MIEKHFKSNEETANTEQQVPEIENHYAIVDKETADDIEKSKSLGKIEDAGNLVETKSEALFEMAREVYKDKPEKLNSFLNRVIKILKSAGKIVAGTTLLFGAFVAADHKITRWEGKLEKDPQSNSFEYKHQDPETTHLLKVFAGKEKLTDEEEINIIKENLTQDHTFPYLVENGFWNGDVKSLKNASENDINLVLKSLLDHRNLKSGKVADETNFEKMQEDYIGVEVDVADDTVYESLAKIMQENGNPKIRISEYTGTVFHRAAGSYDALTNTVYLRPSSSDAFTLISELAHSKQFNDAPIYSSLVGLRDLAAVVGKSAIRMEKPGDVYEELYEKEGTIENDAHSLIEPSLRNSFKEDTKNGPQELAKKEKLDKWQKEKKEKSEALKAKYDEQISLIDEFYQGDIKSITENMRTEMKKTKDADTRIAIIGRYDKQIEDATAKKNERVERIRDDYNKQNR